MLGDLATLLTSLQTCEDKNNLSTKKHMLLLFAVNENESHWILFAADVKLQDNGIALDIIWRLHDSLAVQAQAPKKSQMKKFAHLKNFVTKELVKATRCESNAVNHIDLVSVVNGPQRNYMDCGVFAMAAMDAEVSQDGNDKHTPDIIPILRGHIAALFVAIAKAAENESLEKELMEKRQLYRLFSAMGARVHHAASSLAAARLLSATPMGARPTAPLPLPATSSSSAPGPGLISQPSLNAQPIFSTPPPPLTIYSDSTSCTLPTGP